MYFSHGYIQIKVPYLKNSLVLIKANKWTNPKYPNEIDNNINCLNNTIAKKTLIEICVQSELSEYFSFIQKKCCVELSDVSSIIKTYFGGVKVLAVHSKDKPTFTDLSSLTITKCDIILFKMDCVVKVKLLFPDHLTLNYCVTTHTESVTQVKMLNKLSKYLFTNQYYLLKQWLKKLEDSLKSKVSMICGNKLDISFIDIKQFKELFNKIPSTLKKIYLRKKN